MKPEELRIGNWIKGLLPDGKDLIPSEFQLTAKMIYEWDDGDVIINEPIPLTPEWLESFGVSNSRNQFFAVDKDGYVWYDRMMLVRVKPKYVHQLQNLYFALTGEELKQIE
jgi:hypothetical protein